MIQWRRDDSTSRGEAEFAFGKNAARRTFHLTALGLGHKTTADADETHEQFLVSGPLSVSQELFQCRQMVGEKRNMKIEKSTRHNKIIGDFGEAFVCNWFSRSGFEVTIVDHTGIDIIAYNPKTRKRLGISVKSRTRGEGREGGSVTLFSYQKGKDERQKVRDACTAFACEPWIAVYVESTGSADLYVLSLDHYDSRYRGFRARVIDDWKMGRKHTEEYAQDPQVQHIHMDFEDDKWEWECEHPVTTK